MNENKTELNLYEIGNRIVELRKSRSESGKKGMNQEEFARFLGWTDGITANRAQGLISNLETGKKELTCSQLLSLSQKCGVSLDWILTGQESHDRKSEEQRTDRISDLLRALFTLVDSSPLDTEAEAGSISIGLKLTIDDIKSADPSFMYFPQPEDGLDEEYYHQNVLKLFLYFIMEQLRDIRKILASDSSGMARMMYAGWKENLLRETDNYRLDCSMIDRKAKQCKDLERITNLLEDIHDPMERNRNLGISVKFPETVQEFFSRLPSP